MNKEKKIREFLDSPYKIGEIVYVTGISYKKDKKTVCKIISLNPLIAKHENSIYQIDGENYKIIERSTMHIGANPFSTYKSIVRFLIIHYILYYTRWDMISISVK